MAHRTDRDFDSRDPRNASYPGADDAARTEDRTRGSQPRQAGRREGRSDRDIQSDYSGGGYDQVSGYRSSEDWYQRGGGYGQAQSPTLSPDDDSVRGDYQAGGPSGVGYAYGSAGAGGVGYGAPGYGAGRSYGAGNYDYDRGPMRDEGRGFGDYTYNRDAGMGDKEYDTFSRQGRHGQEDYGQWQRGMGERDYRTRGGAGQGYGAQGYSARNQGDRARGYGSPGGMQGSQGSEAGRTGRSYRGLGPRNYTRSDERIREDLNERLTDAHDIDATGISVEVNNGVATLAGTVEQRWMKHRAEDLAEGCSGVRDVRNQIRVQPSDSAMGTSAGYASGSPDSMRGSAQGGTGSSANVGASTGNGGARSATGGGTSSSTGQYGTSASGTQGSSASGSTGTSGGTAGSSGTAAGSSGTAGTSGSTGHNA